MKNTKSNNPTIEAILKSACGKLNDHLKIVDPEKEKRVVKPRNDCKEVQWIHWQLKYWCQEKGYELLKEHLFHWDNKTKREIRQIQTTTGTKRKLFRFDFAIKTMTVKIGIEYDGLNSEKSGHTTWIGYTSDTEKMNLANIEGWKVLRFTWRNYKNVLQQIEKILC